MAKTRHRRFYSNKKCMGVNLDNKNDSDKLKTHLVSNSLYFSSKEVAE